MIAQQFGRRSSSLPRHSNSDDVMSPAPRVNPSGFKMGDDSPLVAGSKSTALGFWIFRIRPLPSIGIFKKRASFNDIAHLPCVIVPVGCKTPHSPITKDTGNFSGELITNQSPLVMARLSPRVGEESPDLIEACIH